MTTLAQGMFHVVLSDVFLLHLSLYQLTLPLSRYGLAQDAQPLRKLLRSHCASYTATAQATQPLRKGCTATAQGLYKLFSHVVRDYSLHHRCLHYCYHCLHCLHHCDVLLLYLDTARHQKKRPNSETTDLGAFLTLTIFGYLLISKKAPKLGDHGFGRFFEFQ